jgi:regulator of sigma E protease
MYTLIIFIIVLGILVFVHELGHFVVARILGIGVDEFGFGFPPRLWSIKWKNTEYSINCIPLGGFVRLHGEQGEHHDSSSFSTKPARKRFAVLLAGVGMNIILAVVIFSIGLAFGLPSDVSEGLPYGAKIKNQGIQIVEVQQNSPAQLAGLQVGDILIKLDGKSIQTITDAQNAGASAGTNPVEVVFQRKQKEQSIMIKMEILPGTNREGLGVALVKTGLVSFSPPRAVWEGIKATGRSLVYIVIALKDFFVNIFVQHKVSADVAGPVGIAVLTGQVARLGLAYLAQFTALLSLNLALINLLPIPALDGGRILFLVVEKVRGKALSQRLEAKIHNTGFAILLALIVLVTFRDIFKLDFIKNIFQHIF